MLRTDGGVKERFVGFYAEEDNSLDMIIIGSSPVYPAYIAPKIWGEYGIAAYPISSNQQRPRAAIHLIEEVRKTQENPLFVFEMRQFTAPESSMTENMAYTRGITDNMKYSLNRVKMIQELVPKASEVEESGDLVKIDDRLSYYLDIFKYHTNWKTLILPKQIASYRYEDLHPLKGYEMNIEVGPSKLFDYSHITEEMPIPPEQEEILYELLEYLKENQLESLFIVTPYTMTKEKQMKYNYMEKILKEYGQEFINFNDYYDEIGIDFATDFYDFGGHTNALGAEKVTNFFMDYMNDNYQFEDKRGNEDYESWDRSYELWLEENGKALESINQAILNKEYAEKIE